MSQLLIATYLFGTFITTPTSQQDIGVLRITDINRLMKDRLNLVRSDLTKIYGSNRAPECLFEPIYTTGLRQANSFAV